MQSISLTTHWTFSTGDWAQNLRFSAFFGAEGHECSSAIMPTGLKMAKHILPPSFRKQFYRSDKKSTVYTTINSFSYFSLELLWSQCSHILKMKGKQTSIHLNVAKGYWGICSARSIKTSKSTTVWGERRENKDATRMGTRKRYWQVS